MSLETENNTVNNSQLDAGTYEVIRNRLVAQTNTFEGNLQALNEQRKEVFGAIETGLINTDRLTTQHNCVSRDMVSFGEHLILGYNVHLGLKSEMELSDVFHVYHFDANTKEFRDEGVKLLKDDRFESDFRELYKYYKETTFAKFVTQGAYLYLEFSISTKNQEHKAFKFSIDPDGGLTYIDNRSDRDIKYPVQHDFEWVRTHRDLHRKGKHPHVSILDRVFVETVGGDLTIKVEDNTESGQGIYAEAVEDKNQSLDDADYFYADLGNLILLKIKPYQEKSFRYFVFNEKLQEVKKINAIEDSCILLPEEQGIIFSNGYYLQSGELKEFENDLSNMRFERKVASPNGEDFLYVFYHVASGSYILFLYNLIEQKVEPPILCHGFTLFNKGELLYFRSDEEPKKHHSLQLWQTNFYHADYLPPSKHKDHFLYKVGNKEVVQTMSDCYQIVYLTRKDNVYQDLYLDIVNKTHQITDNYFWVNQEEAKELKNSLLQVRETAQSAIDEYEKVLRIQADTAAKSSEVLGKANDAVERYDRFIFQSVNDYVNALSDLRALKGRVIGLKDLRYADISQIDKVEEKVSEFFDTFSNKCVEFLLREDSLAPYMDQVKELQTELGKVSRGTEGAELLGKINETGEVLELLIQIVSNLKIDDPTQVTVLTERISDIYSKINALRSQVNTRVKDLRSGEAIAEFGSQVKLVEQSVISFLEISDTPEKCEENLTKVLVQLEELEGKFADFDDFIIQLSDKRTKVYETFESKKNVLVEARNKRAVALQQAAERILQGIKSRVGKLGEIEEIHSYFASDLMAEKIRKSIHNLRELGDPVKADDLQGQLKNLKEEAIRQLKDKKEIFEDGEGIIKFGDFKFSVNKQLLDLTMVLKEGDYTFHLTGTDFFEPVNDEQLKAAKTVWDQVIISENNKVYRGEFLAYQFWKAVKSKTIELDEKARKDPGLLQEAIKQFMAPRLQEGYVKGVHDVDAKAIVSAIFKIEEGLDWFRFTPDARAFAALVWHTFVQEDQKELLRKQAKGLSVLLMIFPESSDRKKLLKEVRAVLNVFPSELNGYSDQVKDEAAEYLLALLLEDVDFQMSYNTSVGIEWLKNLLIHHRSEDTFKEHLEKLLPHPEQHYLMALHWAKALAENKPELTDFVKEIAVAIHLGWQERKTLSEIIVEEDLKGLIGDHQVIEKGHYTLHYHRFFQKLRVFEGVTIPAYEDFQKRKALLVQGFKEEIYLEQFTPNVLSSFVRNKLINEVYLPLIGANLAKQIGVIGENKRTDLMGMLLLISPPGYGKTTLMEYVANRLGLIFMKINGPSIGHQVTSLDPQEAPNATAREELEKLNLAFEMGNNVMVYVDDIQHCNPEFLQKFISLCDGQRKIEGVYKGRTKTYNLQGKKVCVVMAGNPYTETGGKFQIPDMLANRADTYNLGDVIGETQDAFKMSYLENCMTSNSVLARLSSRSAKDLYGIVKIAETGSREGVELEGNYQADELQEIIKVVEILLKVREVIWKVNQLYIQSAAQSEAFRTEPSFKLQGSYRNMNKIAEKVHPVMNADEVSSLILSHYENEVQTLTNNAEANLLKFKVTFDFANAEEIERWDHIKTEFVKLNKVKNMGEDQSMAQLLEQLGGLNGGLEGIKEVLSNRK